jgi:hypothetical protein
MLLIPSGVSKKDIVMVKITAYARDPLQLQHYLGIHHFPFSFRKDQDWAKCPMVRPICRVERGQIVPGTRRDRHIQYILDPLVFFYVKVGSVYARSMVS